METNDIFEELEHIIGAEAANRFVDFYSGASIYIPQSIVIKRNHHKIREEFNNGASYRELGIKYGYTEQHIRNITKAGRKGR